MEMSERELEKDKEQLRILGTMITDSPITEEDRKVLWSVAENLRKEAIEDPDASYDDYALFMELLINKNNEANSNTLHG